MEKNRIRIIISPKYRNKKVDDKKLLDLCKRIISVVQNKFEIIDGKPLSNYSSLGTYFWHSGYKKTDERIDFYKELDNITKIIVYTEDKIIENKTKIRLIIITVFALVFISGRVKDKCGDGILPEI